ncbi:MAG: peroxiredoxin family protein, partial [Planctomycetaceae bacterium]
ANANNDKRAKGFLEESLKRKQGVSERESMYIEALDAFLKADRSKDKERNENYARALEKILYRFPEDLEAKAFLGLQLWLNRSHGSSLVSHLAVDALLKEVLAKEPLHPCHHYRIHLWDYEKSDLALDSSARCGQGAPGIAHMWHMPGHIYSRLQRYEDAVWQQEASARVDHAYMIRDRLLPDEIHNYAHNNEWLCRNLAFLGRVRDGLSLARNLGELPRHPRHNPLTGGKSAAFSRQRLFELLNSFELWDELITLCDTPLLEATDDEGEQVKRLRHLACAHIRRGTPELAAPLIQQLRERQSRIVPYLAILDSPKSPNPKSPTGGEERPSPPEHPQLSDEEQGRKRQLEGRLRPLDLALIEIQGHQAVARADFKAAHDKLQQAGGVDPLLLARVQLLLGERDKALDAARSAVDSRKNEVLPLAGLVDLLWLAGDQKEAADRMTQLREVAGRADLDVPALRRLAPVVQSLGLPADWRIIRVPATDVGARPELATLGPYRWTPSAAPGWALKDAQGKDHSSADWRGKPHVLIFYLGSSCLHCAQQLQAFAPLAKDYEQAGIGLMAISTDSVDGLRKSLESIKEGQFVIPLLTDASLQVFKAFRVHDDFENKPLHGTFFIDGNGLVRWQDIGHEPFQDSRFLLNEAKRLLALPPAQSGSLIPNPSVPLVGAQ